MIRVQSSYHAFGLIYRSEVALDLPEAPVAAEVDVEIKIGSCLLSRPPLYLAGPVAVDKDGDDLVAVVPGAGTFRICEGRTILVEPERNASSRAVSDALVGFVLGYSRRGKDFLSLHGAAASRDGTALVVLGAKGAGKSTLVSALCAEGYRLLCDDLVPALAGGFVGPSLAVARLAKDSYESLTGESIGAASDLDSSGKRGVKLKFDVSQRAVRAIILLEIGESGDHEAEMLRGWRKFNAIVPHIQIVGGMEDPAMIRRLLLEWAGPIPLWKVRRPRTNGGVEQLLAAIHSIGGMG